MAIIRGMAAVGFTILFLAGVAQAGSAKIIPDDGMFNLPKLPNGGRPLEKIQFPRIANWSTLKITLDRSQCFGECPIYSVKIFGDGTVRYEGLEYVAVKGTREAHISEQKVRALYDAFVKADFFWTLDYYSARVTDFAAYRVTISFDGRTKTVFDYVGMAIGMPKEIIELENAIDETAGTKRWVDG